MTLEAELLQILVCPIDKLGLLYFPDDQLLYNPRLRRGYAVENGVPVLLANEAAPVADAEHASLLQRAGVGAAVGTLGQPAERIAAACPDASVVRAAEGLR